MIAPNRVSAISRLLTRLNLRFPTLFLFLGVLTLLDIVVPDLIPFIDEIGLETAISHLVYEQRQRGGPEIECTSNVQFGRLPPISLSVHRIML